DIIADLSAFATRRSSDLNQNSDGGTMTCKSSFPYTQDAHGVVQVQIGFIKEHVPQTRADYYCHYHVHSKDVDVAFRFSLRAVYVIQYLLTDYEPQSKEQPIPSEGDLVLPERHCKNLWITVPDQIYGYCHNSKV